MMDRFWSKVCKSEGCWEWTAHADKKTGYGVFRLGSLKKAHRVAYELAVGPIPDGKLVLHQCDNRRCVRPEHLFLGTQQDNVDDMLSKHRDNLYGLAKIDLAKADEIRALHATGKFYQRELAAQFGISEQSVWKIIHNLRWPSQQKQPT